MTLRPRWEDRVVWTHLSIFDVTNPITTSGFILNNLNTQNGAIQVVVPRDCKLVGYGISTFTFGDTTPGNWTVFVVRNNNGGDNSNFSVNVTVAQTKQTHATVPWSEQKIYQAGDDFLALMAGPSKNALASFLTLEWELI